MQTLRPVYGSSHRFDSVGGHYSAGEPIREVLDINVWSDLLFYRSYLKMGEYETQKIRKRRFQAMVPPRSKTWKALRLCQKAITEKNELDLVFLNENGQPMDYHHVVKRHCWPALSRSGIRKIRFHDLRHIYAALLIDQGEYPKYIQTQMGHSSINVTMDTHVAMRMLP